MEKGFITIDYKMLHWEWFTTPNTAHLFQCLLLKANWKPGRFRGIEIKRGQLATSLTTLAKESGLSVQSVRTALKHLKSTGELTEYQQGIFRLITITKYNDYQDPNRHSNRELTGYQQGINNNITREQGNKGTIISSSLRSEDMGEKNSPTPKQNANDFFEMLEKKEIRYHEFCKKICESKKIPIEVISSELEKFKNYWREKTLSGKKERWELQKTFEVQKRLATWFSKIQSFRPPEKKSNIGFIS